MLLKATTTLLSLSAFLSSAVNAAGIVRRAENRDVSEWLAAEVPIAVGRMLAHVNDDGAVVAGAVAPFTPDAYQEYWVRDGGFTLLAVIEDYKSGGEDAKRAQTVVDKMNRHFEWTKAVQETARVTPDNKHNPVNPERMPASLRLGYTKFSLSTKQPVTDWANPQYDGPALRALCFIRWANITKDYAKYYNSDSNAKSVIKSDLEVVANALDQVNGIEPWEEIVGVHFFDLAISYRALVEGADFAAARGDGGAADFYRSQAAKALNKLNAFWDGKKFKSTLNGSGGGANEGAVLKQKVKNFMDISTVYSFNHALLPTFPHTNPQAQATFSQHLRAFTTPEFIPQEQPKIPSVWWAGINSELDFNGRPINPAVGRYPEDIYDGKLYHYQDTNGAGFWFLATNAMAEFLYRAADAHYTSGVIEITDVNREFWNLIKVPGVTGNRRITLAAEPGLFNDAVARLVDHGDRFLRRTQKHTDKDGYLSEQLRADNGFQQGPADLSWSYASVVTAGVARRAALAHIGNVATPVDTCAVVADNKKVDCHPDPNVTVGSCLLKGCCWQKSTIQGVPWCFNPSPLVVDPPAPSTVVPSPTSTVIPPPTSTVIPTSTPTPSPKSCNLQDAAKKDCGYAGINESQCVAKGCCWKPSTPNSKTPWCFVAA
ncbi:Six-hairpin glycosidase-like protein [Fimicolochytrium jonesii]|uniref:Six-hairpin glycosidase-like protein n=1 Tax=Fimicolochytrium jonesii TaxID=1396493 RepID=UPI0022FDBE57|nr:Six-hairpin glycosidase-like protein [Fimicolochytrium jonesii]KAI8816692.1 Six-hairpin glycosidase-like protein [Fimicolochytrium jonesii]